MVSVLGVASASGVTELELREWNLQGGLRLEWQDHHQIVHLPDLCSQGLVPLQELAR